MTYTAIKRFFVFAIFGFTSMVMAAENTFSLASIDHNMDVTLDFYQFNKDFASENGIGNNGIAFGLQYRGVVKENFTFAAGISFIRISDKDRFEQTVREERLFGSDDTSVEKSEIGATTFNIESGYIYPLNEKLSASFHAGYRIFSAEREISNCNNCYSEDIDFKNSAYLRPQLDININDKATVSLGYTTFTNTASTKNSVQLAVKFDF